VDVADEVEVGVGRQTFVGIDTRNAVASATESDEKECNG
jgi:hypothetical protein